MIPPDPVVELIDPEPEPIIVEPNDGDGEAAAGTEPTEEGKP